MSGNTELRNYIDQLTDGQLDWAPLDETFDTAIFPDKTGTSKWYPIKGGEKEYRNNLVRQFPHEEATIDQFIAELKELTDNEELRAVLSYPCGDYGNLPEDAPWPLHALLVSHFLKGASYPRGGASEIAFNMIPVIEEAGGKVLVRAPVSEILLDSNGKACGVRVSKGTTGYDILAPIVISDAGVINTFQHLLPPEIASKSRFNNYIHKVGNGIGALSLFVGLNGSTTDLNLRSTNYWAYSGHDISGVCKEFMQKTLEDAVENDIPLLFVSFPSAKDPEWDKKYPDFMREVDLTLLQPASKCFRGKYVSNTSDKEAVDMDSEELSISCNILFWYNASE